MTPIRRIQDLDQPRLLWEDVHVLSSARVLWANDTAISDDFPQPWVSNSNSCLHGSAARRLLRRSFVLSNAGIISSTQVAASDVNEHIPTTGETRRAVRPPRYGRALVIEAYPIHCQAQSHCNNPFSSIGLLDIKGIGSSPHQSPQLANHRTGLLLLPLAFEEIINQMLIEAIMRFEGLDVRGVPIYAVLDLGFRGRIPGSNFLPCAAIVRAAHRRPIGGVDLPCHGSEAQRVQIMLELILRRHGLTSATPMSQFRVERNHLGHVNATYGNYPVCQMKPHHIETFLNDLGITLALGGAIVFDGINVQLERDISARPLKVQIVDFGHYAIFEQFENPLLSLVSDRVLNWGGVLWPESAQWIQHHKRVEALRKQRIDKDLADWFGVEREFAASGVTRFAWRLARDVAEGEITLDELANALQVFTTEFLDGAGFCEGDISRWMLDLRPSWAPA